VTKYIIFEETRYAAIAARIAAENTNTLSALELAAFTPGSRIH
jgi:hypothetical protein